MIIQADQHCYSCCTHAVHDDRNDGRKEGRKERTIRGSSEVALYFEADYSRVPSSVDRWNKFRCSLLY